MFFLCANTKLCFSSKNSCFIDLYQVLCANTHPSPYEGEAGRSWSPFPLYPFIFIHSSYPFILSIHLSSRKKDESERNVGVLSSKARTQVFLFTQWTRFAQTAFRISLLNHRLRLDIIKKKLACFSAFSCEMPTCLPAWVSCCYFFTCNVRNCKKRSKLVSPK